MVSTAGPSAFLGLNPIIKQSLDQEMSYLHPSVSQS
jgi:hypothetical protein